MQSNIPPSLPPSPAPLPDYTTPAVVVGSAVIVVGMIVAVAFGPRSLGDALTPLLLTLLTALIPVLGVILNRKMNALHGLVNSRMDQSEAKNVEAMRLAKKDADVRVQAAEMAGEEKGRRESQHDREA